MEGKNVFGTLSAVGACMTVAVVISVFAIRILTPYLGVPKLDGARYLILAALSTIGPLAFSVGRCRAEREPSGALEKREARRRRLREIEKAA